ncbi:MAG TPA: Gmad2 immunoglobulin-like domain-containing protein [Actinomycetota bacterium]
MKRSVVLAAVVGLFAVSCAERGPGVIGPAPTGADTPTGEPTESPVTGKTVTLEVWFAYVPRGERPDIEREWLFVTERTLPATQAVGRAALAELFEGPTREEGDAGVSTAAPDGTEILDLSIDHGTATVDLSSEFESGGGSASVSMRLAQLTYTLTQFPTVGEVALEIEGAPVEVFSGEGVVIDHPMARRDFDHLLPPILVASPVIGERVRSPITIAGSSNVFEATVSIAILDENDDRIAQTFTTATCGTGCRGDYETNVSYELGGTQEGTVVVFESSAEDGSPIHVVEIPVTLVA